MKVAVAVKEGEKQKYILLYNAEVFPRSGHSFAFVLHHLPSFHSGYAH
jgi:hypothetical protein